ncbi:diguanylate cyclase domain-containing protein [Photobacterium atrarenae]|uniref:diguanylate cyclase n=1 Tax=Photobacterium atrarenae TaxID=865757 RepID=A0ABY5GDJ0_9GAMM|nr:diguanylate cyclase [Photobacterium atrarenae]UTV27319.1 diguanylate cyclase [Photobacterium atrarenae]
MLLFVRHLLGLAVLFMFPAVGQAAEAIDRVGNPVLLTALLVTGAVIGSGLLVMLVLHLDAASFRRLQTIFTDLPLAVAIIRRKDGTLLYANKRCCELIGVRKLGSRYRYPDEITAQMMCDYLRPLPYRRGFQNAPEALRIKPGHTLSLAVSGQPIRFKWQAAWLLYLSQPPQQPASPDQLEQEQRIFQQVLNSLSELVYYQNNRGEIIGTNKAFNRFWRGRFEEGVMEDENTASSLHPLHTWTTAPDGTSRLLETNKTQLIDDHGEVIGTLSISHDVTDWHDMQESLQQEIEKREITEQALAQRSSLLNTIFEASSDPIGLYNEHGIYVGCNEPFARALGYTQQTLLGKSAADVLEPDKWEEFQEADRQVLEEGKTVKADDYVILEDGTPVWYEMVKTPYRDPTDGVPGVLVMARDVTERRMAEQQLADAIMELEEMSFVDSLTKVANRRYFDEQLRKLWHSHIREQKPLTLILCDIDSFKAFNDNYGHQQGDYALREVAKVFRDVIRRETDEVARYGGEEFAFLLPNTDQTGGLVVAEKVHQQLAAQGIVHEYSGVGNQLTVSLGVATITPLPTQDYGDLVEMADIALYKAKAAGRNCTMVMTGGDHA